MSIEEELFTILSTNAGVQALVGSRIYPVKIPQRVTLPCITYNRISTAREHTHDRAGGLAVPTFQFTAWSGTPDKSMEVITAIREALDGYTGETIQAALSAGEFMNYDPDGQLFYNSIDIQVWHDETPGDPEPPPMPE